MRRNLISSVSAIAFCGIIPPALAEDVSVQFPQMDMTVAPPKDFRDVQLYQGYHFVGQAAVNPVFQKYIAVGIGKLGGRPDAECLIKRSADGGKTWTQVALPHLPGDNWLYCNGSGPAVAWGGAGQRLYAAYAVTDYPSNGLGYLVAVSTNNGATWSAPVRTDLGASDSESQGIRISTATSGDAVYLAALSVGSFHPTQFIQFTSSKDKGVTWAPSRSLAYAGWDEPTYISGFSLAGGANGKALLAYTWQGSDYRDPPSVTYTMHMLRSANYGMTFTDSTIAQGIAPYPDNLGLLKLTDPDVQIGKFGTAHMVYNKGNRSVLYRSSIAPYATWSADKRLDRGLRVGTVSLTNLAVGTCGKNTILHVTWVERTSEADGFYRRNVVQQGPSWSPPLYIGGPGEGSMLADLAAADGNAFQTWETRPYDASDWTTTGSRISSGITCP